MRLLTITLAFFQGLIFVSAQVIPVEDFGAVGNGSTDDSDALNTAFSKAPQGSTVVLTSGKTYAHNDILRIEVPGLRVTGGGRLLATNEERSGVWIDADHVVMEYVTLEISSTTKRWTEYEKMKLRLMDHDGIVVRGVNIDGSAAAGIFVGDCHNFVIDRVVVRDTRADAIHTTEGSSYGTIIRPRIYNPGDDGVAFVSYNSDSSPVNNMLLQSPVFLGSDHGRAYSVVGGHDITMNDLYAKESDAAGLYIASEDNYDTMSVRNIRVNGASFIRCNQNDSTHHGSVLIYNGQSDETVEDIRINNLHLVDGNTNIPWQVGLLQRTSGGIDKVKIRDVVIKNGPSTALYSQLPLSAYSTILWIQDDEWLDDHYGLED